MIGLVIVSHSAKVAQGVQEMAEQMSQGRVSIAAAGGVDDETLGTNAERILAALQQAYSPEGVLVLMDLGSAVMSAQMAIEMMEPEQQAKIQMSDAPLVEGAIVAAVEASLGRRLEEVKKAAEAASTMRKIL
jgi:dihydroxyacetone kinase phosphotransfer subunit